mgnify:CR=1 FL=1
MATPPAEIGSLITRAAQRHMNTRAPILPGEAGTPDRQHTGENCAGRGFDHHGAPWARCLNEREERKAKGA